MKALHHRLVTFSVSAAAIGITVACGDTSGTPIVAADDASTADAATGCVHGDAYHEEGEVFPMGDGCNSCYCRDGRANCTTVGCTKPMPVDKDAGSTRLSVDLEPCTIMTETVARDQGPNLDRWMLELQASCTIGEVRIKVVGSENAPYPQTCPRASNSGTTVALVVARSGDLGDLAYDSSHGSGTCRIQAGPTSVADASASRLDLTAVVQKVGSNVVGESHSFAYVGP